MKLDDNSLLLMVFLMLCFLIFGPSFIDGIFGTSIMECLKYQFGVR